MHVPRERLLESFLMAGSGKRGEEFRFMLYKIPRELESGSELCNLRDLILRLGR